ncbi:hypothetical protein EON67_01125 [archaeon]|nr:MAG: hypothetical protein EON67_01125 [archaeon]
MHAFAMSIVHCLHAASASFLRVPRTRGFVATAAVGADPAKAQRFANFFRACGFERAMMAVWAPVCIDGYVNERLAGRPSPPYLSAQVCGLLACAAPSRDMRAGTLSFAPL